MTAPIVAVDVDEVLAHFIPALAEFHNEAYGTTLGHDDFGDYAFHNVWGGTAAECTAKMELFYLSRHFKQGLKPVDGAMEGLLWLKAATGCELHIVTARQHSLEPATRQWVDQFYPGVFTSLTFGNHYGLEGKKKSKPQMCRDIGALCLIDDSQIYAGQCAEEGIPCVLFGNYAWNSHHDKPGGAGWIQSAATSQYQHLVRRASDWGEARELLRALVMQALQASSGNGSATVLASVAEPELPLLAVVQMCSGNDKQANLDKIRALATDAAAKGASLVCLPECCVYMGTSSADTVKNAENLDGASMQAICSLARELKIWVSVGGFHVPDSTQAGKISNVHVMVDPLGAIQGQYGKMHLFDNPLTDMHESDFTTAGGEVCTIGPAQGCFAKVGLSVCYDVRFPELYGRLCRSAEDGNAGGHGAEVVLVPSAFMVKTGQAHWEVLLRARAIENQVYVVAAAQAGPHNATSGSVRTSYGHSLIVDPWGTVVAQLDGNSEGVTLAPFSRQLLLDTRRAMPVQAHRRPNMY